VKFEEKIKVIKEMLEMKPRLSDIAEKTDMSPRDVKLIIETIRAVEKEYFKKYCDLIVDMSWEKVNECRKILKEAKKRTDKLKNPYWSSTFPAQHMAFENCRKMVNDIFDEMLGEL